MTLAELLNLNRPGAVSLSQLLSRMNSPQEQAYQPMLLAGDGVSNQTKKALIDLGLYRAQDLMAPQPTAPVQAPAAPVGDPTRQVTQQQYDQMLQEQRRRAQEKYLQYKTGGNR